MVFCLPQDGVGMESWGDADEEIFLHLMSLFALAPGHPG